VRNNYLSAIRVRWPVKARAIPRRLLQRVEIEARPRAAYWRANSAMQVTMLAVRREGPLGEAAADEPVFVLRGSDPLASSLVETWARCADVPDEKRKEAQMIADEMRCYAAGAARRMARYALLIHGSSAIVKAGGSESAAPIISLVGSAGISFLSADSAFFRLSLAILARSSAVFAIVSSPIVACD